MSTTARIVAPLLLVLCACQSGDDAGDRLGGGGEGGLGMGGASGAGGEAGLGGQGGAVIENPLGTLVECDQLIEDVISGDPTTEDAWVRRHRVTLFPVADPTSVTITRCDGYEATNGTLHPPSPYTGSKPEANCHTGGSWVYHGRQGLSGLTFTPNFEVYVECEEEDTRSGETSTIGARRVYVKTHPPDPTPPQASPLGVAVQCDEVTEESNVSWSDRVTRQRVATVPVDDPTAVAITRCGYYSTNQGTTYLSSADCDTSVATEITSDSEVIIECEEEATYPIGVEGTEFGVATYGYEHVYLRLNADEESRPPANPLGVPVECDDVLEWELWPGTTGATRYRAAMTYLPVADPTSVTLTRCGESNECVSRKSVSFTEDFEVYVECELEVTDRDSRIHLHREMFIQVD